MSIGSPFKIFTGRDGQPLNGGYIFIGQEGLNPQTNPVAVFSDSLGLIPLSQPVRTSNGYPVFNGSPARIFVFTFYSISVLDDKGQLVFTSLTDN